MIVKLLSLVFLYFSIHATEPPALYKGRFRPLDVAARLWFQEIHHSSKIDNTTPLDLLWEIHLKGHEKWDGTPLFWIQSARLKNLLGLDLKRSHFSFQEISSHLNKDIEDPEFLRLQNAAKSYIDPPLFLLPSRNNGGEWLPLKNLENGEKNFTAYSQETFHHLKKAFPKRIPLSEELVKAYSTLAETPYVTGFNTALFYPSFHQLNAESLYYQYLFILIVLMFYVCALIAFSLNRTSWGLGCMMVAFGLHSTILAFRCFILGRPPVTNMFETILYVPWIGILVSFCLYIFYKNRWLLFSSSLLSVILLILMHLTGMNNSLDNVQAVLNSQYWLLVHVLMVVGSYGVFLLSGILGHLYLFIYLRQKQETPALQNMARLILQSIYLGVALLIPGTILGGVWAAESWGRFWDWDPKESWAFISICLYLIWIHAYNFHRIHNFGLAIGSIISVQAVIFTWYGVNYILGTGLHSYGFGSGGEIYYTLFLSFEVFFLIGCCWRKKCYV